MIFPRNARRKQRGPNHAAQTECSRVRGFARRGSLFSRPTQRGWFPLVPNKKTPPSPHKSQRQNSVRVLKPDAVFVKKNERKSISHEGGFASAVLCRIPPLFDKMSIRLPNELLMKKL